MAAQTNRKQMRRQVPAKLSITREQDTELRKRAFLCGLRFNTWLTRLVMEELKREPRLPPAV